MFADNSRFKKLTPEISSKIEDLICRLTLEEKITMIGGAPSGNNTVGCERLGIPPFRMGDGPGGVHWFTKMSTSYPCLIMTAATFDTDLIHKMGVALGRDCKARGVHILLGPGVNMYRSPLCGRNFEYCGEDPYLSGEIAGAYIKGVQSQGVSATVKHFALNFQEYGRLTVSSDVDERPLREIYLPAFEAAVKAGGTGCVMSSYNLVNGEYTSEHKGLITEILKNEWGFDGMIMSDWGAVHHGIEAVIAGLDVEMPKSAHMSKDKLIPALESRKITVSMIDEKIRRQLRLGFCFGWMDHDQMDPTIPLADFQTMQTALDVARSGLVLLKNENSVLPLERKKLKKIAVIGSSAHPAVVSGGGSAYNPSTHIISMLEAIRHSAGPDVEVVHAMGADSTRALKKFESSSFLTPEGKPGLSAEYFNSSDLSGAPVVSRNDIKIDFNWWNDGGMPTPLLTNPSFTIRWKGILKGGIREVIDLFLRATNAGYRAYIDGKCIFDRWEKPMTGDLETVPIEITSENGHSLVLEFKKYGDSATFQAGFEYRAAIEKDKADAMETVKNADVAIVCTGFNQYNESEGSDRPFSLAPELEDLIISTAKIVPKTVLVLTAGGNVDMSRWIDHVQGLVLAWYPGQEGGTAVAEALFGIINPSGKLPATFEKRLEDRGSFNYYHDEDKDNRVQLKDGIFHGYRHFDKNNITPRFPFGFGLSYTTFRLSQLKLSSSKFHPTKGLEVSFEVENTGLRAGAEVAQIYIRDIECSVARPVKELKGFVKVNLKPGEKRRVSAKVDLRALQFWDTEKHCWKAEPGDFEVLVGTSCENIALKAKFRL